MSPDEERWAEVLAIQRMHGDRAHVWVAERLGMLVLQGDEAGITRFREIAARLDQLMRPGAMH